MAYIKISQLPETQTLSTTDVAPFVASGVTYKVTLQRLAASMPQVSSSISSSYTTGSAFTSTNPALSASYALTSSYALSASYTLSSSYAVTASFVRASSVFGLNQARIFTGSISASVNVGSASFELISGSSAFIYVSSSGNVGIGTSQPDYKLEVSGITKTGTLTVSTNGQSQSFSTYYGANSDGNNIFIGNGGQSSVGAIGETYKGSDNVSLGFNALLNNTTGDGNTAVGKSALLANNSGRNNTAVGESALFGNGVGYNNTAVGASALSSNQNAYNNVAVGVGAMSYNFSGYQNSVLGTSALGGNTTGNNNIAIGYGAGGIGFTLNANTTGDNNIFIGYQTVGVSGTESNRTWIGTSSTTSTWLAGNLILGTTTDEGFRANISGSAKITNDLQVTGSLNAPSITGSLFGTSSWAINVVNGGGGTFPYVGDGVITGSLVITNQTSSVLIRPFANLDVDTGTEVIASLPTSSYDAAFFDYVAKDGTNYRAGTLVVVWNTSTWSFTDTSVTDIGNTSPVTMEADVLSGNVRLKATVTTDNWIIKTSARTV